MNATGRCSYYAFISYSHKDQKWAEWIQHAIEHYRLPAIIRREVQKQLPKRIAPVFRDATDLGVDVLVDGLHEELEKSKFLIVVCSPNSAKPNAEGKHFVDEEVRHFCELGRVKQIIPVIIEGTPEEAFGPVLKSQEVLAIDATKCPRARVLNDIVAKILGLKPDVLWRRAERERRRRVLINSILGAVAGIAIAAGGLFAWDNARTVVARYADYVDSYGLPEGIFPMGEDETTRRYLHYRFEYRGLSLGKSVHADSGPRTIFSPFGFRRILRRVIRANSAGYPIAAGINDDPERPEIQDFEYHQQGFNFAERLTEKRCGIFNGKGFEPMLQRRMTYENQDGVVNAVVRFYDTKEGPLDVAYLASISTSADNAELGDVYRADICQFRVERDAAGRETRRLFLSKGDENVPDADGLYGKDFVLDNFGRIVEERYLFLDGDSLALSANKHGVAGKRIVYDGREEIRTDYVDVVGRPIMGPKGFITEVVAEQDAFGNPIVQRYIDADGKIMSTTKGYAEIRSSFDDRGNVVRQEYFSEDGEKTVNCEMGVHAVEIGYDATGRITSLATSGIDGERVCTKNGVWAARSEYDENSRLSAVTNYGIDGKPVLNNAGWHRIVRRYDREGRMVEELYYGVDGKLVLTKNGTAGCRMEYDSRGRLKRATNIGANGEIMTNTEGLADMRFTNTKQGNVASCRFYDAAGNPTYRKDGTWGWGRAFDSSGNVVEESFLGRDGSPSMTKYGYAIKKIAYCPNGNPCSCRFYDASGKPVRLPLGYHEILYEYDTHGCVTREVLLDVEGSRVASADGVCEKRQEFDARGNVRKTSFYGVDGKPTANANGVATLVSERDECGNRTSARTFDANGCPVAPKGEHCALVRFEYERRGLLVSMRKYDVNDNPCIQQLVDAFEMRYEYDAQGREISRSAFNAAGDACLVRGAGIHKETREWDAAGNLVRLVSLGIGGNPVNNLLTGYCEVRTEYDRLGRVTKESWFCADGTPYSSSNDGVCAKKHEYDVIGNEIRVDFFGEDGSLKCGENGYATVVWEHFSNNGYAGRIYYLDESGKRTKSVEGFSAIVRERNPAGLITKEAYLDEFDRPLQSVNGTYATVLEYDPLGRKTRESYLDANGKTCVCRQGFASISFSYDERGNVRWAEWRDLDGRLAKMPNGYSRIVKEYDDRGNSIYAAYFGADGNPTMFEGRASERCAEIDNMGWPQGKKWFDAEGKEIPTCSLVIVGTVLPGSPSEACGMAKGDVICIWGPYSIARKSDDFDALGSAIEAASRETHEKTIVVARKKDDSYEILHFRLPPGKIGCQIVDEFTVKSKFDAILKKLAREQLQQAGGAG